VTVPHRIRFYQQLAVLARAGVPLRASLQRLHDRFSGREAALLSQKIDAGEKLGEAFIAAGFSPFECHLVAAGERSAQLETVFQHLSEYWSRQQEMREAILRPLYYPLVVLHLSVLLGALVELASLSWDVVLFHFLMRLSLLYLIGALAFAIVKASWASDAVKRFWLYTPLIGSTLSRAYAYRWITALRIEYVAGIPLPNALADAWRASGYVGSEKLALEGQTAMREGTELSLLVQRWKLLPRDWIDFIETGEISGSLETAFVNLEAEAARAWQLAQQRLTDWLPKIVYFILLLIIGAQVLMTAYQEIVAPISNAENAIDNAVNGK
jgi:type II secretory pathway component PulF